MNNLLVYNTLKEAALKWPNSPAIYDDYGMLNFEQLFLETEVLKNKPGLTNACD